MAPARYLASIATALPVVQEVGFDWYVDSVHGSDANTGKSKSQAFQTLAQLLAVLGEGDKVGLARGSHWREQLTLPGSNISLAAYGSGDRPLLDASDLMAGWSKTAGRTYVYQITCTPEWAGSDYLNVWEDDSFLVRAGSLAACDSTPASYYPSGSSGEITLYVHASGDGNPASNGKTYEYSQRQHAVTVANSSYTGEVLNGLHLRRNLEENGAVFLYKQCSVVNCLISDGSKHNIYIGEGSLVANTICRDAYYGASNLSYFVFYTATGTGLDVYCINCRAENTTGALQGNATGFTAHTSTSLLGNVYFENIYANQMNYVIDTQASSASMTIAGIESDGCNYAILMQMSLTVSGLTHSVPTDKRAINMFASDASLNLSDSTITLAGTYASGGLLYSASNTNLTVNLDNVHFIGQNNEYCVYITATGASVTVRNCDFESILYAYRVDATGVIDSDYNRFRDACAVILNGTTYATLALWQAAGQDMHSTME